eukprot:12116018-Karenia_brevis.AAC.1
MSMISLRILLSGLTLSMASGLPRLENMQAPSQWQFWMMMMVSTHNRKNKNFIVGSTGASQE